jgi:hypothetical protein
MDVAIYCIRIDRSADEMTASVCVRKMRERKVLTLSLSLSLLKKYFDVTALQEHLANTRH